MKRTTFLVWLVILVCIVIALNYFNQLPKFMMWVLLGVICFAYLDDRFYCLDSRIKKLEEKK